MRDHVMRGKIHFTVQTFFFHFKILYSNDRVIEITVCTNQFFVDITEDKEIEMVFTYSVKEVETQTPLE